MVSKIKIAVVKAAGNTNWTSKALSNGTTYYSEAIPIYYLDGYASLLVKTTDSITLTFEVSADKQNWYTPKDTDGNSLNAIGTAITTDTWISFAPQIAGYIRIKAVANADTTTSLTLIQKKKDIRI